MASSSSSSQGQIPEEKKELHSNLENSLEEYEIIFFRKMMQRIEKKVTVVPHDEEVENALTMNKIKQVLEEFNAIFSGERKMNSLAIYRHAFAKIADEFPSDIVASMKNFEFLKRCLHMLSHTFEKTFVYRMIEMCGGEKYILRYETLEKIKHVLGTIWDAIFIKHRDNLPEIVGDFDGIRSAVSIMENAEEMENFFPCFSGFWSMDALKISDSVLIDEITKPGLTLRYVSSESERYTPDTRETHILKPNGIIVRYLGALDKIRIKLLKA